MRRRWPLAALALTLVAVSCFAGYGVRSCPALGACITAALRPERLPWALGVTAATAAALAVVAWALRLLWVVVRAARGASRLTSVGCPPALAAAAHRTGVGEVVCLRASVVHAFCAGPVRPRLYVTEGALTSLRPEELDAVLLHEAEHRRRRDPLRRAARRAMADVLFFLPILEWWWERMAEREELAADRAALRGTAPRWVASALLVMGSTSVLSEVAAFDGAADARVAQLLGEPLPRQMPPFDLCLSTVGGLAGLLALASCAVPVLIGAG